MFTIGHSTRTIEELTDILLSFEIKTLADIRSFPKSLTNPQFNTNVIGKSLGEHQIQYVWLQKLGGRRKGFGTQSKNTCWRNKSFRNYADYMETETFREGIDELIHLAGKSTVAIMCAESLYWRCHRSMISDHLKSIGVQVTHLIDEKNVRDHEYTQCARIIDGKLTYHEG